MVSIINKYMLINMKPNEYKYPDETLISKLKWANLYKSFKMPNWYKRLPSCWSKLAKACLEHISLRSIFLFGCSEKIGKNCYKRRIGLYKLSQCGFIAEGGGRGREEEKEKWEGGQSKVQRHLKILKQQSKISTSKKL